MNDLLESIRMAVADGATIEQKAAGAQACRTILTALDAEAGKPIVIAGAPPPNPLAGVDPTHALDLLIARLRAALPGSEEKAAGGKAEEPSGLRIAFVRPPVGTRSRR